MPKAHTAVIEGSSQPMPGTRLLMLRSDTLSDACRPGQCLLVRCNDSGLDPYLRRALPVHRLWPQGPALLFRPTDRALAWLAARPLGTEIDVVGPVGRGFALPPAPQALGLIAQGPGIAPLLSIVDRADCAVQLLLSAPTPAQTYPPELLPRHVEYAPHVGARADEAFWQAVRQASRWAERLYAAGPPSSYARLQQLLAAERASPPPPAEAWVERPLVCGQGACQGCLVPTKQGPRPCCTDGPAFDLAVLLPAELGRS